MVNNIVRYPIALVRGKGATMWDADGKEYLDLFAGFGGPILGHCHPELVQTVHQQAQTLWHVGNLFHTEPQTRIAGAIHRHGFAGRSLFSHSGADANDAAIKLARLHGKAKPHKATGPDGRYKVITALGSFHGRSFGGMVATGQEKVRTGFSPHLPGFVHVPFNDLAALKNAIDHETCAVMLEPIQGEGGVNMPSDDYLPGVRALCDEHDLAWVCDEVWTGCGRTGRWFAHQHWSVAPDIMTLAKGVGGGLPVGVMCANEKMAAYYDAAKQGVVRHATTLGGNCLSMAVAAKIFEIIERDNLLHRASQLGQLMIERLNRFAANCPHIKQVRGKGLFVGVELTTEHQPWFKSAKEVVDTCLEKGLLINAAQSLVLRLAPALVVTDDEVHRGLDVLERVIAV
ncbi:MAG: acetylornithine/succinylornithine family transaminase [Phycisphaera sp.]|nr:acetylornithine/succinylornithine family transaminase [Phycisphaera sp.]